MPLGGHAVAGVHVAHERAHLHHVARELVADGERRLAAPLRPVVPLVDVDVGAADAGAAHADQHLIVTDGRLRHLLQHEARRRPLLHECSHDGAKITPAAAGFGTSRLGAQPPRREHAIAAPVSNPIFPSFPTPGRWHGHVAPRIPAHHRRRCGGARARRLHQRRAPPPRRRPAPPAPTSVGDASIKELALLGVDAAKQAGAQYADVRISENRSQTIFTRERRVQNMSDSETFGIGVRVLVNGAWGFAAGRELTRDDVQRLVKRAVAHGAGQPQRARAPGRPRARHADRQR